MWDGGISGWAGRRATSDGLGELRQDGLTRLQGGLARFWRDGLDRETPGSETGAVDVGSGEDSGRTSYMEDL